MVNDSRVWDKDGFLVSGAVTHPMDDAVEDQVPGVPGSQPDPSKPRKTAAKSAPKKSK